MRRAPHPWHFSFSRAPYLDDVDLMHASNITHVYPTHMHEQISMGVMLRGVETMTFGGSSYTARAGTVLLINAEEFHSNRAVGSEYRLIKIAPSALQRRGFLPRPFPTPVVRNARLFRSLARLHHNLGESASQLEAESELMMTLDLLFTRHEDQSVEHGAIRSVRQYLKSHYAENVALTDLASLANLSPFHLLRVFRNQVGVPPHEYQMQIRVAHARKLIRDGHSLAEAALRAGFFDQSHLSRNFKRVVGLTPGEYFTQSKIMQDHTAR